MKTYLVEYEDDNGTIRAKTPQYLSDVTECVRELIGSGIARIIILVSDND